MANPQTLGNISWAHALSKQSNNLARWFRKMGDCEPKEIKFVRLGEWDR
jgi:hypothetical protein